MKLTKEKKEWTGVMGFTKDEKPIIGRIRKNDFICGGYTGHGMPRAFLMAKKLAQISLHHFLLHFVDDNCENNNINNSNNNKNDNNDNDNNDNNNDSSNGNCDLYLPFDVNSISIPVGWRIDRLGFSFD